MVFLSLLVLVLVISMSLSNDLMEELTTQDMNNTRKTNKPNEVSIGETIILDKIAYTVQTVEKSDRRILQERPGAGMLISVFLQMENKGRITTTYLSPSMFVLTDSKDRVFTVIDESAKDLWTSINSVRLQPDIPIPAYVIFEVPFDPELSYTLVIQPYDYPYDYEGPYDRDDMRFIDLGLGSSFDLVKRPFELSDYFRGTYPTNP